MSFKKTVEDFICTQCGVEVKGNGFTNHCPGCLWSKHVDVDPGDRLGECKGMMKPIDVEKRGNEYKVVHECITCGFRRPSPLLDDDSFDTAVVIMRKRADERM